MKNRIIACIAIVSIVISMCGCHSHEFSEATCSQPMTCTVCGDTEGELLPHTFAEASCAKPKTCTVCGATEGELLSHTFSEATCTKPKTCTVCGKTEGSVSAHTVSVGKCTKCGTIVNQTLVNKIESELTMSAYFYSLALSAIETTDSTNRSVMHADFIIAYAHLENFKSELRDASYICKGYSELSTLKAKIDKVTNVNISMPSSKSTDDLRTFLLSVKDIMDLYEDVIAEWSKLH